MITIVKSNSTAKIAVKLHVSLRGERAQQQRCVLNLQFALRQQVSSLPNEASHTIQRLTFSSASPSVPLSPSLSPRARFRI